MSAAGKGVLIMAGGTGGHVYPAIAISEIARRRFGQLDLLFVGVRGRAEEHIVPAAGIDIRYVRATGLSATPVGLLRFGASLQGRAVGVGGRRLKSLVDRAYLATAAYDATGKGRDDSRQVGQHLGSPAGCRSPGVRVASLQNNIAAAQAPFLFRQLV